MILSGVTNTAVGVVRPCASSIATGELPAALDKAAAKNAGEALAVDGDNFKALYRRRSRRTR